MNMHIYTHICANILYYIIVENYSVQTLYEYNKFTQKFIITNHYLYTNIYY